MIDDNARTSILVSGTPRSGSTWLGKILSLDKRVRYLHEPFHPKRTIPKSPFRDFFRYLPPDRSFHNEDEIKSYVRRFLSFKTPKLYDVGDKRNSRRFRFWHHPIVSKYDYWSRRVPLVKDPLALLGLEWIVKNFEGSRVVIIIRHPAAFVHSSQKAGFFYGTKTFLKQHLLLHRYLSDFKEEMISEANNEKKGIANQLLFWRMMHKIIYEYKKKYSNWLFVRHEDLSAKPLHEFSRLYEQLGLDFSNQVKTKLLKFTQAENETRLHRHSMNNIHRWKTNLGHDDIKYIKEKGGDIWPFFYTEKDW